MEECLINGYKFVEETIGVKRYLAAELGENKNIIDFEINMLVNNPSLGFLNVEARQVNEVKKVMFEIDSRETLKSYFDRAALSKTEYFDVIKNMFMVIKSCREFMLDTRRIILEEDLIFIDANNKLVSLLFIPVNDSFTENIEERYFELCTKVYEKNVDKSETVDGLMQLIIDRIINKRVEFLELDKLFVQHVKKDKPIAIENSREEKVNDKNAELVNEPKQKIYVAEKKEIAARVEKDSVIKKEKVKNIKKEGNNALEINAKKETSKVKTSEYISEQIDEELGDEFEDLNYGPSTNNQKTNSLMFVQLVVVMLIGSLVVLLSLSDKGFSILMAVIIVFDIMFCILIGTLYKKGKKR